MTTEQDITNFLACVGLAALRELRHDCPSLVTNLCMEAEQASGIDAHSALRDLSLRFDGVVDEIQLAHGN